MALFGSRRNQGNSQSKRGSGEVPFTGYERMSSSQLIVELPTHSQVELAATEKYERENARRDAVLNKLRYLRGHEPIEGYDKLDNAAAITALDALDMSGLKRIRGYERKFKRRPDVLEAIVRLQQQIRAATPAEEAPAYQSLGGAAVKRPTA